MSNPNDPAYAASGLSGLPNGEFIYGQPGMTIRQDFVKAAMQGLLSAQMSDGFKWTEIATQACIAADAALAEEAKTRGEA